MRKRVLSFLVALAMLATMVPSVAFADNAAEIPVSGNLLKVTTTSDFQAGTLEGLELNPTAGNGAVQLTAGATEGTFTSAIYSVTEFEYMVASWNASIYPGGVVEIWARAYIEGTRDGASQNDWTGWMSWGPYSPYIVRGSEDNKSDTVHDWAYLDQDTLSVRGSSGATKLQLKAVLRRDNASQQSPVLNQITATYRNTNSGKSITPTYAETDVDVATIPLKKTNPAPAYAQGIRDPEIGGSICSPTTLSVLLNSRDPSLDILPEELALAVIDMGEGIFGNWSFTTSTAGLYGYESYGQFADVNILLKELAKGNTVGLSVKYSASENGSYPYLPGALSDTGGHLISIIGYEYKDDIRDEDHLYFYSSDSYSRGDSTAYHYYQWKYLKNCWPTTMAYIIPAQTPETGVDNTGVAHVSAVLEQSSSDPTVYTMKNSGQKVDLTAFVNGKTSNMGHGVLGYTVQDFKTDMIHGQEATAASVVYANPMQVTANNTFYYSAISTTAEGDISLDGEAILKGLGVGLNDPRTITVYAMANNGVRYSAALQVTRTAEETVVVDAGSATQKTCTNRISGNTVNSLVHVAELSKVGDAYPLTVGVLIPEDLSDEQLSAVTGTNGSVPFTGVTNLYTDTDGNRYAQFVLDGAANNATVVVRWSDTLAKTYQFDLTEVVLLGEEKAVSGNLLSAELGKGTLSDSLFVNEQGALTMKSGATSGVYLSPIYATMNWEYLMANLNAYTPGQSGIELQVRAKTQVYGWSDWYSFGVTGTGIASASKSYKGTDLNMNTDVLSVRGDSSIANASPLQIKLIFTGNANGEQPKVYSAGVTIKKAAYSATEGVYTGSTAADNLPASAGRDLQATSSYGYSGQMSGWRFENMELMMLNAQGADLLYEEVAFAGLDMKGGWGNWAFTNFKPGFFGYQAYTQYSATTTMVKQALADGNIVGLFVHGGKIPSTNSAGNSQTVVYAYYTAADGTVMFKLACPRGDSGELADGDVYGECTEAQLATAISGNTSDSACGIMYVVGRRTTQSSWKRYPVSAKMTNDSNNSIALSWTSNYSMRITLPTDFVDNYDSVSGKGGLIAYTLGSETTNDAKLAAGTFYYGITVNADGTLAAPQHLKTALLAGDTAKLYVICNNGYTLTSELQAYTADRPINMNPVQPTNPGETTDPEQPDISYTDVNEQDWFAAAVKFVSEKGLMDGYQDHSFNPNGSVSRAMVVTVLYRLAGSPDVTGTADFTDVTSGSWYEKAVIWAAQKGIAKGQGDGTFDPNENVTREQLMAFLYRFAQEMKYDLSAANTDISAFADANSISEYAKESFRWGCGEGYITGRTGNQLAPQDGANRAELATLLMRIIQKNVK